MYSVSNVKMLHFEHQLWMKELAFFQDELKIYEHRLEELDQASLGREDLASLERFQNRFIRQKEVLDQLSHDVKVHEQRISRLMQDGRTVQQEEADKHEQFKEDVETFRKLFKELKKEFFHFYAETKPAS